MQNKILVRTFALLLILASFYSLSFTYFTKKVESDAEQASGGDAAKRDAYLDSMRNQPVYFGFTYAKCKEQELTFGLDLQGGMNVTLDISVVDVIKSLCTKPEDPAFRAALSRALEMQKSSGDEYAKLFVRAYEEETNNGKLAPLFVSQENSELKYSATNKEVLAFLSTQAQGAIDNSFKILRTRIDRFGVTSPNIQQVGGGRILVELPGVKDQKRVRKLLQGTAQLEFWETYTFGQIYKTLEVANKRIADERRAAKNKKAGIAVDTSALASNDSTKTVVDSTAAAAASKDSTMQALKSAATKAKSEAGKPSSSEEYPIFSVLQPTGGDNALVGYADESDTAKVNRMLLRPDILKLFPGDLRFAWSIKPTELKDKFGKGTGVFKMELVSLRASGRSGKPAMTGEYITGARTDMGNGQGKAEIGVSMAMNVEGARQWANITTRNVGRQVAIVLDGMVCSFPNINEPITGGNSSITGGFEIDEANDLANVLQSGKMPAPARIVEEVVVGPSLGQESIDAGMMSFIIAFILVLLFMIAYYAKAGLVANVALIVNIILIFGVLVSMGAVLTLPGIAGIVLTLGMAVDANIIIYERIREEIDLGKDDRSSIADGFKHAMSALIDGNLTTMLTGIVLYIFGSGPIQGFATTLVIGLLTTLFTAIFVSRLVFEGMLLRKRKITFGNKISNKIFKGVAFKFMSKRKMYYVISSIVIGAGLVSCVVRGWDLGIDFTGGRTYVVRFDQEVPSEKVRETLKASFEGQSPDVKIYGANHQLKITTKYKINDTAKTADTEVENLLFTGLKPIIGEVDQKTFESKYRLSSQKVGPTVADDIVVGSIIAVIVALIGIFLYIFVRFRNWAYGLGGVISLLHDALFVLGAYSILWGIMPFTMEIDQAFIAAILTVIGYSINDTVIVYDRLREYIKENPEEERIHLFDRAINSTLGRTINTVMTVMLVLIAIFIFGGDSMRGFIFAMLIGVGVGTYSSIFIASATVVDLLKIGKKK